MCVLIDISVLSLTWICAFLVLDAGEAPVSPVGDPLLVDGQARHEPGGLQEKDGGEGDGAADAEGLQSRQYLQMPRA